MGQSLPSLASLARHLDLSVFVFLMAGLTLAPRSGAEIGLEEGVVAPFRCWRGDHCLRVLFSMPDWEDKRRARATRELGSWTQTGCPLQDLDLWC